MSVVIGTEVIEWHPVAPSSMPDEGDMVLLDWDTADPWPGYRIGLLWFSDGERAVTPPQRWAYMPEGVMT